MEKQLTALQQSIDRKKDQIKELEKLYPKNRSAMISIVTLLEVIAQDEKLLAVEEEQMIRMHVSGQLHADRSKANRTYAEQHFNNTFKND